MKSKYVGQIIDGNWKVVSAKYDKEKCHTYYLIKDQVNSRTMVISDGSLYKILNGKTTVSHIIHTRIHKEWYK